MTVTYNKSKLFKRPKAIAFIDGPFYPEGESVKEKAESLKNQVADAMKKRSSNSDYNYIEYFKK